MMVGANDPVVGRTTFFPPPPPVFFSLSTTLPESTGVATGESGHELRTLGSNLIVKVLRNAPVYIGIRMDSTCSRSFRNCSPICAGSNETDASSFREGASRKNTLETALKSCWDPAKCAKIMVGLGLTGAVYSACTWRFCRRSSMPITR